MGFDPKLTYLGGEARAPERRFTPLPARAAFAAALSVYALGGAAQVGPREAAPGAAPAPGVQYDFRCESDGDGGFDCSVFEEDGSRTFFNTLEDDGIVLERIEFFDGAEGCFTDPGTELSLTGQGVGVVCLDDGEEDPGIGPGESVSIEFQSNLEGGFDTDGQAGILGIYISGVNGEQQGNSCRGDFGVARVTTFDGSSRITESFSWSAPAEEFDGGDTSICLTEGEQTIFLPFSDLPVGVLVESIALVNQTSDQGSSVFFLGTEDCDGGELTDTGICQQDVYSDDTATYDTELLVQAVPEARIAPVDGFPIRVQDTRAMCQPGADPGDPGFEFVPLPVDQFATIYRAPLTSPQVNPAQLPLTILGSAVFTISSKACGVPRANLGGAPNPEGAIVDRNLATDWTAFIDLVAINADFDPTEDTTTFLTGDLDSTPYECAPVADTTNPEFQPLFEINAREDEIKYVKGVGMPMVDPVGRDIMVGCGSKRANSRRWSYLAYNLIHAPGVDFRAETRDEINTLVESINRVAACVDSTYHARVLRSSAGFISRNYAYFERFLPISAVVAEQRFFNTAVSTTEALRESVINSRGNFDFCWSDASTDYVTVLTAAEAPDDDDKPLNAYGDIVSQLEHLAYVFETFRVQLTTP